MIKLKNIIENKFVDAVKTVSKTILPQSYTEKMIKDLPVYVMNGYKYYVNMYKYIFDYDDIKQFTDWKFLTQDEIKQLWNQKFDARG